MCLHNVNFNPLTCVKIMVRKENGFKVDHLMRCSMMKTS